MSMPLSPLTSSGQNSRLRSPTSPGSAKEQGSVDEMTAMNEYPENTFSSPFKAVVEDTDTDADPQGDMIYDDIAATTPTAREAQVLHTDGEDEYEAQSVQAPSSPFQYDARDETVDFQKLQEMNGSPLAPSENSTTPQKRAYESVPGEYEGSGHGDGDCDPDGRCRKGANRRDDRQINVYTDEDASFLSDQQKGTGGDISQEAGNNSMMDEKHNEGMSTVLHGDNASDDKENNGADDDMNDDDFHDSMDDTGLSTFSAVPNADMTSFAKLRGDSPAKPTRNFPSNRPAAGDAPHRSVETSTPMSARMSNRKSALIDLGTPMGSPTPRRRDPRGLGNPSATPNLLDIDQPAFSPRPRYSVQNARYSPTRQSPLRTVRESIRSPSKVSLLDFDLPPAPTPRSVPTVTPRELESLKSSFMSEISSLKATLSGREAEVSSLKQAVSDAERRVGEALEEARNEAARKESLEVEQSEWERRGQEMESVLREVKADIVEGEREKAQLSKKMEEAEKSRDQLESRMVELESQLAAARNTPVASSDDASATTTASSSSSTNSPHTKTAEETAHEVQDAVEKVARELHTLYKGKHETKVAALKKSYETRWEKRVREAANKLKGVEEENERLKVERANAATSGTFKSHHEVSNMMAHANDEHEAEKRVFEAQIKGMQQEMAALRDTSERLRADLNAERAEKGDLVAAVDEWLAIQQNQPAAAPHPKRPSPPASLRDSASREPSVEPSVEQPLVEEFRRSVSSGSGIRPPSTTGSGSEKKIPKVGVKGPARVNGGGAKSGIAVFTPGRSGIMGSIERMGRGG